MPDNVIPVLETFIARKHKKSIGITLINQSDETKWIPQGQHICTIHLVKGRTPLEEEVQEIIHQLKVNSHDIDEVNTGKLDDFITSNDQVQSKRPVQYSDNPKLSPGTKRKLDKIINEYSDIFSKNQYDIRTSIHPLVEIPTEEPPCISAPYTIPLKFRPWVDNTISKLLKAGMIYDEHMDITRDHHTQKGIRSQTGRCQETTPSWRQIKASLWLLKTKPKVTCRFLELWQRRPKNIKVGHQCTISTYVHRWEVCINQRLPIPDDAGLHQSISWAQTITRCCKEKCIHNTSQKILVERSLIGLSHITIVLLQSNARYTEWTRGLHKKLHGRHSHHVIHQERTLRSHQTSVRMIPKIQNET